MTETIATNNYERRVRISTRANTDTGAIEELHARITGKAVTLTRVSTARKPKSFWISEEEINMLVAEQTAYLYWLKQREVTLKEAKALINEKLQPGDINFKDEYHSDGSLDETYEIYRVEGWPKNGDPWLHEETIWEHVALEDLIEQIKDAQQRVKEADTIQPGEEIAALQELAQAVKTEGLEPPEMKEENPPCAVCGKPDASGHCTGCGGWFCGQHFLEHMQDNAKIINGVQ